METEKRVMTVAEPMFGSIVDEVPVRVHASTECGGEYCPLHNPSNHPLQDAPMVLRLDRGGLIERSCQHGVDHSDPDSVAFFRSLGDNSMSVHGCDGCCTQRPKVSA